MKRIALIVFILFIFPVWFVSCTRCGEGGPSSWIWNGMEISGTDVSGGMPLLSGDTVKTDSVYFTLNMSSLVLTNTETSGYSAVACDPAPGDQKNFIKDFRFGIGSLSFMDTSVASSLVLNFGGQNFEWNKNKEDFIKAMSDQFANTNGNIKGKFLSPHNSKRVQLIMKASRENFDTIMAVSNEIVLK